MQPEMKATTQRNDAKIMKRQAGRIAVVVRMSDVICFSMMWERYEGGKLDESSGELDA